MYVVVCKGGGREEDRRKVCGDADGGGDDGQNVGASLSRCVMESLRVVELPLGF